MLQVSAPLPLSPRGRILDCLGGEASGLYPNMRWLASAQQQIQALEDNLPLGAVDVLGILCQSLMRIQPGQPSLLDAQSLHELWERFQASPPRIWPSTLLETASSALSTSEALLFFSLVDELRGLELRFQGYQRLQAKLGVVAQDTIDMLKLFVGSEASLPDGFQEALEGLLEAWIERLWLTEDEGRHALCTLWATQMAGRFQAPQQEWRYCLASLEQALQRHLGSRLGRLLQTYWNGLNFATGRFELCLAVCKQLPQVLPRLGELPFDSGALVGCLLGDVLLDFDPLQEVWPDLCALNAANSPLGGLTPELFSEFRVRLLSAYRPTMERSWLDLLSKPLERIQQRLDLQAWKAENRLALQDLYASVCTSLREVLQSFAKNPRAEQDLRCLLEGAWDCSVCTRSPAAAEHLFRRWLATLFVPHVASDWQQPRAVLAALKTALQKLPQNPKAQLDGSLQLLTSLPFTFTQVSEGLRLGLEWLPQESLARPAWLGCLAHGNHLGSWLARFCLRLWTTQEESQPRPSLETLCQACPSGAGRLALEQAESKLQRSWLSHQVWTRSEAIARQASAWTFKKLGQYSQQTGGLRGVEKCARDNSFTLRRVALAWELEMDDPAGFVSDWWNGVVGAYLSTRPGRLLSTNLQGLLEASRDYLEIEERAELEAVLRPVYEEASGQEINQPDSRFQPLTWSFPLEQKVESAASLDLSDELVQASLRHAGPFQKPMGPWRALLQEGWKRYLWQGCLDTLFCKRWSAYCQEHVAPPGDLERFLEGLQLAQDNQPALKAIPRLDYFQAVTDFTRQLQISPLWRQSARELVGRCLDDCYPRAPEGLRDLLGDWLEQAAELMATLPSPLWHWEADRYLLEEACRRELPRDFPWLAWQARVEEELGLRLGRAARAVLRSWNKGHLESQSCFASMVALVSVCANQQEPSFSPNPDEETQWRQALSLLIVASWRRQPQEAELVLWAVAHSLKIGRDRAFATRLAKLQDLLASKCPEVSGELYANVFIRFGEQVADCWELLAAQSNWPARRAALNSEWAARADLNGLLFSALLPPLCSASLWGVPARVRLAWTHDQGPVAWPSREDWQKTGSSLPRLGARASQEAVAGPPADLWQDDMLLVLPTGLTDPNDSQRWQRDLRWLARRLAWQGWLRGQGLLTPGQDIHPPTQWYRSEVLGADLLGASLVAQRLSDQDGPLQECYRLLEELLSASSPGLQLYVAGSAVDEQPWFCGPVFQTVCNAACEAGQASPSDSFEFAQILSRYARSVSRLGQLSSAFQMSLRRFVPDIASAGYFDRFCEGMAHALPSSSLDLPEQLRLLQALQAVQNWLRHLRLALSLSQQAPQGEGGWSTLLQKQCQLWMLTSPEQAWLNTVLLLLESPQLFQGEAWESGCQHLEKLGRESLDVFSLRTWSTWCRQLRRIIPALSRNLSLHLAWRSPASPLHGAERATRRLADKLLVWEVLQEGQSGLKRAAYRELPEGSVPLLERLLDFSRGQLLEHDFTSLAGQVAEVRLGIARQSSQTQLRLQGAAAVGALLERFPDSLGQNPDDLLAFLDAVGDEHPESSDMPWDCPRSFLLLPSPLILRLAGMPSGESQRLQTALSNSLNKFWPDTEALVARAGRLIELCRRLEPLQSAWSQADRLLLGKQPAHALWKFMLRRVALEGWKGNPQPAGVLAWLRFSLAGAQALETSSKPFLKAARDVLGWGRQHGKMSDDMNRLAEEFSVSLERHLGGTGDGGVCERLEADEAAPKAAKRSFWGLISNSLGGLVGGR